ncbi:MAG: tRNA 4-thiouridine(8) synthase ThiI [Tenericutes bacterium 4572_104]|nr:MAG: tRNA 4-thiouridine(8) synthase ThiI [Tenericutes bacterium 4572_104]
MYDYIMVRYGDLTLKGRNQKKFRETLNKQLKRKCSYLNVKFEFQHDMIYIKLNDVDADEVISILDTVSGLSSYSKVVKTFYDLKTIASLSANLITEVSKGKKVTFKVETKRADKRVSLTSLEITKEVSGMILSNLNNLIVDVHNPELTLFIEVRHDATYLYVNRIPGMGGFPVSIAGKGLVLLSGGIDSPVSAYLAMKKGLEVDCIHFESTPLTSVESAQKVIDITEKLSKYAPDLKINLHMIPFKDIHEQIIINTPEPYVITIMRRMMYRIASMVAKINDCKVLISGDSIGQVASQTIESMVTIQNVTDTLIIRPLAAFDKSEIIKIAKKIDTFTISNRPFSDCCTVYVPKNPVIRPDIEKAEKYEKIYDYKPLIDKVINEVITIQIDARKHLDIQSKGLTVKEAFDNLNK